MKYIPYDEVTMICENCIKREATIHFTEILKNNKSEYHLCEICAKDIRFNMEPDNNSDSLDEILSFLNLEDNKNISSANCMNCSLTLEELKKEKKLGCPICYNHFYDSLSSIISSNF